jgi:hypothetical protein
MIPSLHLWYQQKEKLREVVVDGTDEPNDLSEPGDNSGNDVLVEAITGASKDGCCR